MEKDENSVLHKPPWELALITPENDACFSQAGNQPTATPNYDAYKQPVWHNIKGAAVAYGLSNNQQLSNWT